MVKEESLALKPYIHMQSASEPQTIPKLRLNRISHKTTVPTPPRLFV